MCHVRLRVLVESGAGANLQHSRADGFRLREFSPPSFPRDLKFGISPGVLRGVRRGGRGLHDRLHGHEQRRLRLHPHGRREGRPEGHRGPRDAEPYFRGNRLSQTTCLTQVFFKSGD